MPEMFGYSFTPGLQRRFANSINGQSPLTPGQSQALQVLALRLPGFLGGATPAPDALLRPSVGGLRPDTAVRAQVAPPQAAVTPPAADAPISAPPSSPLSTPDVVSPLQSLSSLFSGPSNPFGGQQPDLGPDTTTGGPGKTSFHFQDEPKPGADVGLPGGTAGPGPGEGFSNMMGNIFGPGGGRQSRYV